jgi:hypothetical protein
VLVPPLAIWLLLDGVKPDVVLRKTSYVTLEVGEAVQLKLMAELDAAVAARFEGGCGAVALTVRTTLAECDKLPLMPVTLSVLLPLGVELAVATVSVEEPELLMEVGLKLALAPEGKPPALRATVPVNPFCGVAVTV